MYKGVLKAARAGGGHQVLEVGCGTGGFAHLLSDRTKLVYHGFDYSSEAVTQARQRLGQPELFHVADATLPESYRHPYDTVVCTEVLEHIEPVREVIALWRSGVRCVCTVPNFDSSVHVRYFTHEDEVRQRYGDLIDIESVTRIKKPMLPDNSPRNRVRHLIWNRYQPLRLLSILGLGSFDDGGWFLFVGRRR